MADRLEVQFVSINQRATNTRLVARAFRCGDPVVSSNGTMIPRTLITTINAVLGPLGPKISRLVELYTGQGKALARQQGLSTSTVICSLYDPLA